jgi:DNA-binding NarL/FixJ family response regulator
LNQIVHNDLKHSHSKTNLCILLVDDDSSVLEISKKILSNMGNFEVDSSLSVDEAFQKMSKQSYDAVISDFEMPKKNGLEFFEELRSKKNKVVFILFTGRGNEEIASRALNLGVEGYYSKEGSADKVYGALAEGIRLLVKRKQTQMRLSETIPLVKKVCKSSPNTISNFDSNETSKVSKGKQDTIEEVKTKSSFGKNNIANPLPTIECSCGTQILVVPDLQAMVRAIEHHLIDHKKISVTDGKHLDSNVNIEELLIKELFKAIIRMDSG